MIAARIDPILAISPLPSASAPALLTRVPAALMHASRHIAKGKKTLVQKLD